MGAVVVMMIHIATPLMVKADVANSTHMNLQFSSAIPDTDVKYYISYDYIDSSDRYYNILYSWDKTNSTLTDSVVYDSSHLSMQYPDGNGSIYFVEFLSNGSPRGNPTYLNNSNYWFDLDFENGIVHCYQSNHSTEVYFGNGTLLGFETNLNIPVTAPNITFEFSPTMSGTVSRKQTINGESFTSDSLNMYVSNNGTDGQFAMFIVPAGGSVTFPEDLTENNAGFTSSPLYAYIADEWITCTVNGLIPSMLANMSQLYAPCAWHTILSGTVDQCYYIPWEHMNLQANTSYDIVCYSAPNGDTALTNTVYEANAGALYSVTSDLSDVTEIYRSTFTITDPAVYNPDSANGFSHPYDGTHTISEKS